MHLSVIVLHWSLYLWLLSHLVSVTAIGVSILIPPILAEIYSLKLKVVFKWILSENHRNKIGEMG